MAGCHITPERTALRHEVEAATPAEAAHVGLGAVNKSAMSGHFEGRGVAGKTLYRWVDDALRTNMPPRRTRHRGDLRRLHRPRIKAGAVPSMPSRRCSIPPRAFSPRCAPPKRGADLTAAATSKPSAAAGGFVMPETFHCERLKARLTVPSCVSRWRKADARPPEPWDSLTHCRGCPVGAGHAGVEHDPLAIARDAWSKVCSRCLHLTDRLIGGRHCPSCYNRDREARIGRNRKGSRPHITDRLGGVTIAVASGGAAEVVAADRVTGPVELMIQAVRTAKARIAFGRPGRAWTAPPAAVTETASRDDGGAAPRGEDAPGRPCADRPPPGPPTLRYHLLASSHFNWPALLAKHAAIEAARVRRMREAGGFIIRGSGFEGSFRPLLALHRSR